MIRINVARINVALSNIALTVVYYSRGTLKVWSKIGWVTADIVLIVVMVCKTLFIVNPIFVKLD